MENQLWSPIWGWYHEGEWDKKRLESIEKAKQGLKELKKLDGELENLAPKIDEARLRENILLNRN